MTWETFDPTKIPFWTPMETGQACVAKLMEFGVANVGSAFKFADRLLKVNSPAGFIDVVSSAAREQFELQTQQIKELSALVAGTAPRNDEEEVVGLGD